MRKASKGWRSACLTCIGIAAASCAGAADSGFYFGLNAGRSEFDLDSAGTRPPTVIIGSTTAGSIPRNIFSPVSIGAIALTPAAAFVAIPGLDDVDDSDTTFSATLGYTINRYVSVELSYADLGEARASRVTNVGVSRLSQTNLTMRTTQKLSTDALRIAALGTVPLSERWSLLASVGYAFSQSELELRSTFSAPDFIPAQFRTDFNSNDFVVGAGVGFKLSSRWSLRADFERMFEAGAEQLDVDRIGLSAIYRL